MDPPTPLDPFESSRTSWSHAIGGNAPLTAPVLLAVALTTISACSSQMERDRVARDGREARPWVATDASLDSDTGCRIATRLFRPSRPGTDALVVLGPGFLRDQRHMQGLAEALAAVGVPTATLDFCNSRPWEGRPVQNGRDMRRVAERFGARRVVYGGFSAGGLSALAAAWADTDAVGVLALDLVDDRGLGAGLARTLELPLVGLRGDSAPCNAWSNGLAVYGASPDARVTPIPGASHCDFESPTDWLCEAVCGAPDSGSEDRRREIIARALAEVTGLLGIEQRGWRPGETRTGPPGPDD